jgi:serine/threonine protein kinase
MTQPESRQAATTEERPPAAGNEAAKMLSDRLAWGPLQIDEVVWYGVALAEALKQIHDRGSVHGNLEPSQIAFTNSGVELTPGGSWKDVSSYSAPEQIQGKLHDPRSDIFALGAVAYEMLTGRKAFDGSSPAALCAAILERDPAPIHNIPRALGRLVERCLEKKPEKRIQRIQVVLLELKLMTLSMEPVKPAPNVQRALPHSTVVMAIPETVPRIRESTTDGVAGRSTVCPRCGSSAIRNSRPRGGREEFLSHMGVKISRCHRCLYRFVHFGLFWVERPG